MAIYDNDGTTVYEIGKIYDHDGTAVHQIGKVYDNDGTTNSLIYSAEENLSSASDWSKNGGSWEAPAILVNGGGSAIEYTATSRAVDLTGFTTIKIDYYGWGPKYMRLILYIYNSSGTQVYHQNMYDRGATGANNTYNGTWTIDVSKYLGNHTIKAEIYLGDSYSTSKFGIKNCVIT